MKFLRKCLNLNLTVLHVQVQQTILMKYHALFVIFVKAAKFEIVVCCKLKVAIQVTGLFQQFWEMAPGQNWEK